MTTNANANAPSAGAASAGANITATISDIHLEVETSNCIASVLGDRWKGEYYNNTNLAGSPAMVRDDGTDFLNLNFGGGSPSSTCGLGVDNFSARWTRTVNFAAGTYRFTAAVDNGVRLYIDDQLYINQWANLPANTYTADVTLSAGNHVVKMEFVEYEGAASASLSWANCLANVPANRWKGEYFNNQTLAGSPAMVRDDGGNLTDFDFNLNFGGGSPSSACGVVSDNFSARWTRMVTFFANGVFRFSATVDNGVRLYVDGQLKIDKWGSLAPNTYTADVLLSEGAHEVKLEFVEYTGDASVNLSWTFVGSGDCIDVVPADRWKGEYYNNSTFTGPMKLLRDHGDSFLDYDLNQCPPCGPNPSCGLGAGVFSARYTRTVNFARGVYRFFLTADAAAKLYVDGQLRIDKGTIPNAETADLALSAGNHEVEVEYVSDGFPHGVSLSWDAVCSMNVPAGRWKGEYYNNTNLTGIPAMTLDDGDGALNLNFGNDSPGSACGLGADNFSARWTRTVNFAPGPYRFTVTVDDGARLYVDGQLIIDKWFNQPATTYTADVFLSAGNHEIELEYFGGVGAASISLSWNANCFTTVPADRWKGEYYNNTNLSGSPVMVSDNGAEFLNFNFGNDSPGSACGLGADNFSARWTRTVNFAAGTYRFIVTGDDGVRLYIDGQLKIDAWVMQGPTTYTSDLTLSAGAHDIKLEYFEGGGSALAFLSWTDVNNCIASVPADRWRGEYFNNTAVLGSPIMVRNDGAGFLNFNFGEGGPGGNCNLGVDDFSARWTRTVNFAAGTYRFIVTGDDGVRLYIDGQLKIDAWVMQGPTTYTSDVTLSAGAHEIKLEYFEGGGPGTAILSWANVTGGNCLPNMPLPLISSVPQTGGRENIASTAPSQAPKRCGQKIVAAPRAPTSD